MTPLKIEVDSYNREHRRLLNRNYSKAYRKIYPYLGTSKEYSFEDFKTYSVFRHQQANPGLTTFKELSKQPFRWLTESAYFNYDNGKLTSKVGMVPVNDVPESLGVAGSLTIASAIFGLTQADWQNIPDPKRGMGKDLDYKIASTGSHHVVIESKGTIVADNSRSSSASSHMSRIKGKKKDLSSKKKYAGDVCFGLITAADPTHHLKVWITDPEMPEINWSPKKMKLLKRLTFYYNILNTISSRAHITIGLGNRIMVLRNSENIDLYDELPILGIGQKPIEISDSFIYGRSHSEDGEVSGSLFLNENELAFVGLERRLLEVLSRMSFTDILSYKEIPITRERRFNFIATKGGKVNSLLVNGEKYYGNKVVIKRSIQVLENSAGLNYSKVSSNLLNR